MKKILLLFFFSLIFSLTSSAQNGNTEKETKKYSFQMGTDVGVLFKKLLHPKDDDFSFAAPYALTFKSKKNNTDVAFRAGIGGNYKEENIMDNNQIDAENIKRTQRSFFLRLGLEKRKSISKRWEYYYGMDVSFFGSKSKGFSVFDFGTNADHPPTKTRTFSLNPLLGVQFRLTPHLVLQTEATVSFYHSTTSDLPTFFTSPPFPTPFPQQSGSKDFSLYGARLTIPNMLNLMLEF